MTSTIATSRRTTHRAALALAVVATWSLIAAPLLAGPAAAAPEASTATAKPATAKPATAKAAAADGGSFPTTPPAAICGNTSILTGPATAPTGAITVPAGNNSAVNWNQSGATFYFASGTHTLGNSASSTIVPAANTTFIGAPGAILSGQGINYVAFDQTATGVTIEYLTIENFVAPLNNGVVNHDTGAHWTVEYNTITDNTGAGVMIGPSNVVAYNCLSANGQYGFSAYNSTGDSNIVLDHNEITGNNTGNWEVVDVGCGCTGGGKVWNTIGAQITNNYVHNNFGPGIWVDTNNAGILISGNYIANNDDEAIVYEISYNGSITNNNMLGNEVVQGAALAAEGDYFPAGAIYISNSGGDSRVDGGLYSTFSISGNNFDDNWGGVTLFQDANRFCGATPGVGPCTLANSAANLSTCVAGTINNPPYFSDCQWKTQNVSVTNNQFTFSADDVGCVNPGCGENAIIANDGTAPSWSPYLGAGIANAVATDQGNQFNNNTYTGDWNFAAGTASLIWSAWQGNPYFQDSASTYDGSTGSTNLPGNLMDADTATLEGSIGYWAPWYADAVSQSTAQAEAGTHSLQVDVTAPWGWGVQTSNWPGFVAAPGPATIGFWAMSTTTGFNTTMTVSWRDVNGNVLATSTAAMANISGTWQQATANVTAPSGTAYMTVSFTGTGGSTGDLYLDNISVTPGNTTPPPSTNLLDANSSSFETTVGVWVPWYSDTIAQSSTQAQAGTHSLQVNVTAPYGWGIETANWPGFAATPGPQTLSFWALAGTSGPAANTAMTVQWRGANGNVLSTNSASVAGLTGSWQQGTANATAPAGTAYVSIIFTGSTETTGSLYLDDITITPGTTTAPPSNLLDPDTASLEGSIGTWIPWYSDTTAQSTAEAESGTHSLQVNITAAYGWGVQTSSWPGVPASPGSATISFWGMSIASGISATMTVQWRDASGNLLGTTAAALPALSATWQEGTATGTAPTGTAYATVTLTGTSATSGVSLFLDNLGIYVTST